MSLAVVGAGYPNRDKSDRRFEILLCAPGEPVELRPEPKNRHDERAVAVFSARGVQIGYLSAERCGRIGALIREGREIVAVFQAKSRHGAWIRVAFDGDAPRVPEPVAAEETVGQDWWPDPEWDE
ncbi:HIRAN domain-containing protein [Pelagerythrobacter sp.]|uniref:HIRAN domain-containing protein n=1 Tax=Pelagerythrobacter sp. TaxID=2800702 RepID=UPI0035B053A9